MKILKSTYMIRFTFLKDRWPLCESYHKLEVVTPRVERDQSGATAMMTKKKFKRRNSKLIWNMWEEKKLQRSNAAARSLRTRNKSDKEKKGVCTLREDHMKDMSGKLRVVPHSGSWTRWSTAEKVDQKKCSKGYFVKETSREHWGILLSKVITWPGLYFRKFFSPGTVSFKKTRSLTIQTRMHAC